MGDRKRIIRLAVLPSEPTDGGGRVCIHLFVQDDKGPFVEPHAVHPVFKDGVQVKQKIDCKPTRGRLACDPKRNAMPVVRGNITTITPRTDNPEAVTCPKCMVTEEYKSTLAKLKEMTKCQ